ncbi:MAG TPA: hypothetical protein VL856_20475 [Acidimicrobiia bacterium]|nr:hypothetical protein [Acidimicrobiia bacterium]
MSELRDRLEALAARGTRRGADEVLSAAQRDAQSISSDDTAVDVDDSQMTIADDELPVITLEPRPRKRRKFGSIVASAGIAALIGVGALAVTAMLGSGGASSPEGAVRQLADAVNSKDALAAVDVLVPSEVRSMRATVKGITERAAELKIVNEASKPLEGVDLSVDHLQLRTEPLADGYAKVIITSGELSASTHRAQLSPLLQKAQRDGTDAKSHADLSKLAADSGIPTFVVVIRQNGGWYVSPAYTTLEYIREVNQYPAAEFGSGKAAELGAATPEAAVSDALHAWQSANWDRLIALSPPDELPLYDYRAMIDASAADTQPDFTIDNISMTSAVSGDSAVVKLESSGTFGSDPVRKWQVGGSCASFLDGSASAYGGSTGLCLSGELGGTLPFGLMYAGSSNVESTGPVSISLVREGGRWFVSPVTTVLNVVDATVRRIDQRTVYTVLGLAYELPPDGTITFDQPFEVSTSTGTFLSSRVYAFDGQAGQKLVGEISGSVTRAGYEYAYGRLFTAEGDEIESVDFQRVPTGPDSQGVYASVVTLPKTGSYRLVLEPFIPIHQTLTLWNLDHAPDALRKAAEGNGYPAVGECTSSGGLLGGSQSCGSTSVTVTPTTSPTQSSGGFDIGSKSATATTSPVPKTTIAANGNTAP